MATVTSTICADDADGKAIAASATRSGKAWRKRRIVVPVDGVRVTHDCGFGVLPDCPKFSALITFECDRCRLD